MAQEMGYDLCSDLPARQGARSGDHPTLQSANYTWQLRDRLGDGATGVVYKAIHKHTSEMAAVKCFNRQHSMSQSQVLTSREVAVMNRTHHRNIVRLLATEQELRSGETVLVMELCNGGSLMNVLNEPWNHTGMNEADFRVVQKDITDGLRYLRSEGFVHRDLKPGNILRHVSNHGRCIYKISDFGTARQLDDGQVFDSIVGTCQYLHPEILGKLNRSGEKNFPSVADLWSVGVTLYQCATGKLPFRTESSGQTDIRALNDVLTRKPDDAISGVRSASHSKVVYDKGLPQQCKLSKSFQTGLVRILRGILQADPKKAVTFDQYFASVDTLLAAKKVHVYHANGCVFREVLVQPDARMSTLMAELEKCCDVAADDQVLWWAPRSGIGIDDVATSENRDLPVPTTTIRNPMILRSRSWEEPGKLPALKIVDIGANVKTKSFHDVVKAAQTTLNWGHYVLHSVRELKQTVDAIDYANSVLLAICNKNYREAADEYQKTNTSLQQLLKVWRAVSSYFQPQADNYLQILRTLDIGTEDGSAEYEVIKNQAAECQIAIDQASNKGSGCLKQFVRLDFPQQIVRWDAAKELEDFNEREAEMLVMLDHLSSISAYFKQTNSRQRSGTQFSSHDRSVHTSERNRLNGIAKEMLQLNTSCVAVRNDLHGRLKQQWRNIEVYQKSLDDLRAASSQLGQVVLDQEVVVADLVHKSHECFANLRDRSLERIKLVFDTGVHSQEAASQSIDGDSMKKIEKLQQLVATLYESYCALKKEAATSEDLATRIQQGWSL